MNKVKVICSKDKLLLLRSELIAPYHLNFLVDVKVQADVVRVHKVSQATNGAPSGYASIWHHRLQSVDFGSTLGTFGAGRAEPELAHKTLSHYNNNQRDGWGRSVIKPNRDDSSILTGTWSVCGGFDGDFTVTWVNLIPPRLICCHKPLLHMHSWYFQEVYPSTLRKP